MARTAGRDAEETRRKILEAAAEMIGRHGTTVPVSDIAKHAGVSKGGLLYHFPSKEALLVGLATELMTAFREEVQQLAAAEPEGTPGRLMRAYIRASFVETDNPQVLQDFISLAANLMFDPEIEESAKKDAAKWRTELNQDGLDPATVRLLISATDGANAGPLWGAVLNESDRKQLEQQLISMTYPNS